MKKHRKIKSSKFPPLCNSIWYSMIKKWKVSQLDHILLHNEKTKILGPSFKAKNVMF